MSRLRNREPRCAAYISSHEKRYWQKLPLHFHPGLFIEYKKMYCHSEFWSPGFFPSTVRINEEVIKKYTEFQEKIDKGQLQLPFDLQCHGGRIPEGGDYPKAYSACRSHGDGAGGGDIDRNTSPGQSYP
jgi:hypothetical protein